METIKKQPPFEIMVYSKKDLRIMYGVPEYCFRKWLRALEETKNTGRRNYLTPLEVEAVIKNYGVPNMDKLKNPLAKAA